MPDSISILLLILLAIALAGFVFWPAGGLLARLRAGRAARERRQVEDALKYLFDSSQEGRPLTPPALGAALGLSAGALHQLLGRLVAEGLVTGAQQLELTPAGLRWALQVVRAHRLWERYLADEARMPLEQVHTVAHRREHGMTPAEINSLDAHLGHPSHDPHGDPIPDAYGQLRRRADESGCARALTAWQPGERAQITHLEDEPPVAYAQIVALGLYIGQRVTVLERTPQRFVLTDGENEYVIAAPIAANIFLCPLEEAAPRPADVVPLSALTRKEPAEIVELDERCQGFTRRRFLDLGLTPGTRIFPELENAFREPRAYRVRGTLIALRNDQAALIWVRPLPEPAAQAA
jgi:DtxR family Mn-dependent transcriptional regulator